MRPLSSPVKLTPVTYRISLMILPYPLPRMPLMRKKWRDSTSRISTLPESTERRPEPSKSRSRENLTAICPGVLSLSCNDTRHYIFLSKACSFWLVVFKCIVITTSYISMAECNVIFFGIFHGFLPGRVVLHFSHLINTIV